MNENDTEQCDLRLGDLIATPGEAVDDPQVALIGFPCDEGVRRNHGRVGSAKAPAAIREALFKLTPGGKKPKRMLDLLARVRDDGDLDLSDDLEENQEILAEAVAGCLENNVLPIILGGGHETAYGHFLGYVNADKQTHIINWDAHSDVRELKEGKAHSGSPFRQAIEHPSRACLGYTVAGLQEHSVSQKHIEFLEERGCHYFWKRELTEKKVKRIYSKCASPIMATFDIDAVDQAYAPGVSSPTANGLHPDLWLRAAYLAGKNRQVASFDIVEFNPVFDCDGHTARLAALTVWTFLQGLAKRLDGQEKES